MQNFAGMKDATLTPVLNPLPVPTLAAILDHSEEGVLILNREWHAVYCNEKAAALGRTTRNELIGKSLWDVYPDLIGSVYEANYRRAMREQASITFEFYYPPFEQWLETRLHPTPDTLTVFTLNITERKQQTEHIRTEQQRLQNTLNAAHIGTWRWDFAANLMTGDALTMTFFGIKPEQMTHTNSSAFRNAVHPDDVADVENALAWTKHSGQTYEQTHRVVHSDGSIRWIEARGQLEHDEQGIPTALLGTVMDITAQKQAQEALRLSEEKYRLLIETVDQGFCVCEMIWDEAGNAKDYRFLEANPAFEKMSGLANAVGKTALELVPTLEQWWVDQYGMVAQTVNPVRFQHGSIPMGRVFDVFSSSIGGSRIVILFTDITEKVRREQENEALTERLRRSMRETHHRVKNNLQVIASLVEMQSGDMGNEAAVPLKRINQHVQALAVIHDLLTQKAKTNADTEFIGTQAVLNQLIPLLRQTVGERSIRMETDDIILTAEKAASLALLVSECVSNAVKHSGGAIEITLRREGERARLEICDDGDGFPLDFDPLRAANTGLQLIEASARWDLGGDVRYDNHGQGGGRVTVVFPLDADSEPLNN